MQGKKSNCSLVSSYISLSFVEDILHHLNGCNPGEPTHCSFSCQQIGNVRPETEITWSKDCIEIAEDDEDAKKIERKDGDLTFNIGKVSTLDGGRTLSSHGLPSKELKVMSVMQSCFHC